MTDPETIIEMSDFSNLSGTQIKLIPKYEALNVTGSLSKTSSPVKNRQNESYINGYKIMTDPGAIVELSDFSNLSDTIWRLIPKYGVLNPTGSLSKTSSPDLHV